MIVNVIDAPIEAFDLMMFPQQHPGTLAYLQSQAQQFTASLTEAGRSFYEQSRKVFDSITNSEAVTRAKHALRHVMGMFQVNAVYEINNITDARLAQPRMQNFIMANPVIRELYHQNRCDGYSDSYVDNERGLVGEAHRDYRKVTNGVFLPDANGHLVSNIYFEDDFEGELPLDVQDQVAILNTWELIEAAVTAGRDPTSMFGDKLG
jgi:hypothetical protein